MNALTRRRAMMAAQSQQPSENLVITLESDGKINNFLSALPLGHENEGFIAVAKSKPQSGYYVASLSGPVVPGTAYFAIVRTDDVSSAIATATTGQAWGGYYIQAGIPYEVIFYQL